MRFNKKIISLSTILAISVFNTLHAETMDCKLQIYVDNSKLTSKDSKVAFNLLDATNGAQHTVEISKAYNWNSSIINLPCDHTYNLYATEIISHNNSIQINPYGDSEYIGDSFILTGSLSIFYPSRFREI